MCMSVCLCVAVTQSSSGGVAIHYVFPVLQTSYSHTNGQEQAM